MSLAHPVRLFVVLAVGLVAVQALVVAPQVGQVDRPQVLATASAGDLVVGLPLLAYLLLVRRAQWSWTVLGPVVLLAYVIAEVLLPSGTVAVRAAGGVLLLVEVAVVGAAVLRARRLRADYLVERARTVYGLDALRRVVHRLVGQRLVAELLVQEVAAVGLAVAGARRPVRAAERGEAFTYTSRSGYRALVLALLAASAVEVPVVHVLVHQVSPAAAWVVTGLGVYGAVWLLGDLRATRLQPHVLTATHLHLRVGLRQAADVPLSRVASARRARGASGGVDLVAVGDPDLLLTLREPVEVRGLLGRVRQADVLGVAVDDVAGLRRALERTPGGGTSSS